VLAIFLSQLRARRSPVVYEDGEQTRDFVSVHDVVDAILAGITSPAAEGTVINVGSGIPRPIREVARSLARAAGVPAIEPTITREFRRGDVRHCTADIRRAHRLLGFTPRVSWDEGVAELVAWARDAGDAADRLAQADAELRTRGLLTDPVERPGRGAA
jgi:dTDP-L-rhamnose 4-epimerase